MTQDRLSNPLTAQEMSEKIEALEADLTAAQAKIKRLGVAAAIIGSIAVVASPSGALIAIFKPHGFADLRLDLAFGLVHSMAMGYLCNMLLALLKEPAKTAYIMIVCIALFALTFAPSLAICAAFFLAAVWFGDSMIRKSDKVRIALQDCRHQYQPLPLEHCTEALALCRGNANLAHYQSEVARQKRMLTMGEFMSMRNIAQEDAKKALEAPICND